MLSLEELSVLLSLNSGLGLSSKAVVMNSLALCESERFDKRVALATIDKLIGFGYINKSLDKFLFLTPSGAMAIKTTKSKLSTIFNKLML